MLIIHTHVFMYIPVQPQSQPPNVGLSIEKTERSIEIEVFNALKCDLALQNIPLSIQPFKTQPHIENEDVT